MTMKDIQPAILQLYPQVRRIIKFFFSLSKAIRQVDWSTFKKCLVLLTVKSEKRNRKKNFYYNSLNCISCRETIVHSTTLYDDHYLRSYHDKRWNKIFILSVLLSLFPYFIAFFFIPHPVVEILRRGEDIWKI